MWNMLVFLVAAWAGWIVEAGRNALMAVTPIILLSVGTLSYSRRITLMLYLILGLTLILLATVQHDRREGEWDATGVVFPSRKGRQVGYIALVLTAGLVIISAFLSSISFQQVERWLTVRSRPAAPGEERLAKSLGIISVSTTVPDSFEAIRSPGLPRELLIGSGPELSKRLVMTVEVNDFPSVIKASRPWPLYWRSFTYDVYTSNGWRSSNTEESIYEQNQPIETGKVLNRLAIQETVRSIGESNGTLYTAGEPVLVNQPSSAAWRSSSDLFGIQIPNETSYEVRSLIPLVDEQTLRAAGQRYPDWVRNRYLTLPKDLPGRVKELAIQLTSTKPTPYDRVRSIEQYLRTFPYTVNVPRPPSNRDLVDYFLYDLKKGYCDYYASAMVVLARAAGVPARLAIGYASGEYSEKSQRFMVTEADAHSWVEVYFPNTGWVPFEPTASRPLLEEAPKTIAQSPPEIPPPAGVSTISVTRSGFWKWLLLPGALILAFLLAIAWTAYDWLRLRSLSESTAAIEVYQRLRRYGARLAVVLEPGGTPYEYAAALNRRIEALSDLRINPWIGVSTTQQVQAIVDKIVRVSYRPVRLESTSNSVLQTQWRGLRWRLFFFLILKIWKAVRERFSKADKRNLDTQNDTSRDYDTGNDLEE
jgi:transglutaminase-like putative cysteine protease